MKKLICVLGILFSVLLTVTPVQAAEPAPVYELRIYTVHPGKMPDMLARFKNHTTKIFERHGMVNVGYWVPVEQKDGDKLYYILKHKSRAAAEVSWKAFGDDPEWVKVRTASEANGPIVQGVESVFLAPADYSPEKFKLAGKHIFELRTYTTNDDKLSTLDTRFREHTIKLFAKHGMTNIAYWHPTDADKGSANTLIYLLAHKDRDAATQSWANFIADPEWIKVRDASQINGKILIENGIKSVFMNPTDFSRLH
ncbi:hypothetical protein GCM10011613_11130 [Cellvibrio zantedeschiae]|uniref:NIPSNAP domain-containing protein n=1 Tax=Cellvibrio zantedeschiae TaxID=1237077 RepID=A0ABQ3AVG7_9GAMM|nr:NIPSNAP family protein [Cellvibrio zantedeschiae]GGY68650.1 hypothetical protein GCM10011613_11130 [Cellvibrio zantedeschiae]